MKFKIDKEPLSQPEIEKIKHNIVAKLLLFKIVSYITCLVCIFCAFIYINHWSPIILCVGVTLFVVTYFMTPGIQDPFLDLSEIYPSDCETAQQLCDKYPEIDSYRQKVIKLGRTLTNAEFDMMEQWAEEYINTKTIEKLHTING
jgi:hypothetical protein